MISNLRNGYTTERRDDRLSTSLAYYATNISDTLPRTSDNTPQGILSICQDKDEH